MTKNQGQVAVCCSIRRLRFALVANRSKGTVFGMASVIKSVIYCTDVALSRCEPSQTRQDRTRPTVPLSPKRKLGRQLVGREK
jgi:hypothetical protein